MWTLWLVSKALQRLSLRNQSLCIPVLLPISLVWNTNTLRWGREAQERCRVGGYRAATFFPCQFGEHVTLVLPLSHRLSLSQIHTHNQLWKYFSNVKCPGATEATQLSPVGGRSEEKSALYLLYWQTSLKPTGCLSPVKGSRTARIQSNNPSWRRAAIQQRLSPGADRAPNSEYQPKT